MKLSEFIRTLLEVSPEDFPMSRKERKALISTAQRLETDTTNERNKDELTAMRTCINRVLAGAKNPGRTKR